MNETINENQGSKCCNVVNTDVAQFGHQRALFGMLQKQQPADPERKRAIHNLL